MTASLRSRLANLALYESGWLACVLGAARGWPWVGGAAALTLVAVHLALSPRRAGEVRTLVIAGIAGTAVDSALAALGVLRFDAGSPVAWAAPPWIGVMWIQFATIFPYALEWLRRRPLLAAALGAAGGPLAYAAGRGLGAVRFHPRPWLTVLVLAAVWAVALPLLLVFSRRQVPDRELRYRIFRDRS